MNQRERVIRSNAVIDLKIALSIRVKKQQDTYARITRSKRQLPSVDKMEARAIDEMSGVLARSFAPFALIQNGDAHHWQASRQTVHRTLAAVPIEIRVALAGRRSAGADAIAERIFKAVDTDFRLIPLSTIPGFTGYPRWEDIFQQEYGVQRRLQG
ncbi:hypothetical protein [Shinella sp.]|uniref:hypothetical protein n=1 Tax=Shinella sp. TaxID=1870904 RepID=UPI0029BBB59C|nr:hypothetical protein [Shinella sp.]MDX3973323.1 hypothetical protein [Shinella sp.]